MANDDVKLYGLTLDESSIIKSENCSASGVASERARADCPASAAALTETENPTEPDFPTPHVLSDIIIQRYEGCRSGEMFHRDGVAYFKAGHVYKGSFVDGLMHGHGEYTWADGVKYEGDFDSNAPKGHGSYTWLDCSTYEGEVCNGIRHGTGTCISAKTGSVYRGQWHQGQRHGKGTMYYNEGETSWYKGDWENNQRQGWGVRCYPSGDTYEGQWENNARHGEGTMKWIQLGQQYCGQWLNNVQHGHGTYTWFVQRVSGSQYPLRNEYKGEFVQGSRHGQGTFVYASGAVYFGCWKNNKKHGQGKFISKNGQIYEGEFMDDNMVKFPASSIVTGNSVSLLGSDMALNIETLLNRIPEAQRSQELTQVEFAILRHVALLRAIYSLYSSLGHENSLDNTFLLTHIQFWRFLKDCSVHQHGLTLAQLDHLINEALSPGEVYSPFSMMLLRTLISCIVIAAYHIYHREFESSSCVLAECFSKLMKQNIIPNTKNVKGPLYCHPRRAVISKTYMDKCWDIYQTIPKVISAAISGNTMTARHFIWMFKVFGLFDCTLNPRRLLEILSFESPAIYSSVHSNLDLELTFLEFFEALLVCAEVKNTHEVESVQHRQCELSCSDQTSSRDWTKNTSDLSHLASPPPCASTVLSTSTIISSAATSGTSLEELKFRASQSSIIEDIQYKDQGIDLSKLDITETSEVELNKQTASGVFVAETQETKQSFVNTEVAAEESPGDLQLENWTNCVHQFFTRTFFPAYELNLVRTKEIEEEHQRQITEKKMTLEKAMANAKLREQRRAEEEERIKETVEQQRAEEESLKEMVEKSEEKLPENEDRSHDMDSLNSSSAALTTPVTTSRSVDLKQSLKHTIKKKK